MEFLAVAWRNSFDEDEEGLEAVAPFGRDFPGLALPPASAPPSAFSRLFGGSAPADDRASLAALTPRRLALVAADRPADVITALGWMGAVNVHDDPAPLSAVLRAWEERWGARVVDIGFDTLTLTVTNPPRDRAAAIALSAEHFAFCPDNVWQGVGSLTAYAAALQGARLWTFWWD